MNRRKYLIPLPKAIMVAAKCLMVNMHINLGIAPDQIFRLCREKEVQHLDYQVMDLEDYLLKLVRITKLDEIVPISAAIVN